MTRRRHHRQTRLEGESHLFQCHGCHGCHDVWALLSCFGCVGSLVFGILLSRRINLRLRRFVLDSSSLVHILFAVKDLVPASQDSFLNLYVRKRRLPRSGVDLLRRLPLSCDDVTAFMS